MRTFQAPNGNTLTALNDIQADAMIKGGMIEVTGEISKAETKAETKARAKAVAEKEPEQ